MIKPWDVITQPCPNFNGGVRARYSDYIPQKTAYRKISNIRRTQSPNLNVPRLVLKLSLPNPMKPGVKSRTKM